MIEEKNISYCKLGPKSWKDDIWIALWLNSYRYKWPLVRTIKALPTEIHINDTSREFGQKTKKWTQ